MRAIINVTLASLLIIPVVMAMPSVAGEEQNSPEVKCHGDTQTGVISFYGKIEYAITHNQKTDQVCIIAKNTGERNESFGYELQVDNGSTPGNRGIELAPNETYRTNHSITKRIDATKDNHTVVVYSYNGTYYFNFTQEIDTMNEGGIPTPHVENLRIKRNGTKSGQPRLMVDIENEGERTYRPRAAVRTFESGSRYLDTSHSVRLSEGNGDVIVGTVRLYGGKFNPGTKFDRVSFVSYPNGTYEIWEPEFREIPTEREIEERDVYYENETAREEYRGPDVDPISERASKAGAILVVVFLVGSLWYRRRRKRR